MAVGTTDNAKALAESRATQRRYRALARWHVDQGYQALRDLDFEGAGNHFLAAHRIGQLALVEKLREPKS